MSRFLVRAAVIAYCIVFFAPGVMEWFADPLEGWLRRPSRVILDLIASGLETMGVESFTAELRFNTYTLLMGALLPWLLAAMVGRGRPRDLGMRLPNRLAWRLVLLSLAFSLPFLVWMAQSPGMAETYLRPWRRMGTLGTAAHYFSIMVPEHWLLQGVVLGLCRKGLRWPATVQAGDMTGGTVARRAMQWLGLAQPPGPDERRPRWMEWLGLPSDCLTPILISSLLFAAVHVGKDARELILSLPGGLAIAFIAYRTNSWLVPFLVHVITASVAFLLMVAFHPSA